MTDATLITIVIFLVPVLLILAFVLAVVFVRDLNQRNAPPHTTTDLTNMTILFHTMRDVLAQQKQLAADFNKSLDRRVREITSVVDVIRKERELLRDSRTQLNDLLARARELEAPLVGNAAPAADAAPPLVRAEPAAGVWPEELPGENDVIKNWTGLDFGGQGDDEDTAHDAGAPEPIAPEDAEAARDAFRTLLNLEPPAADVRPAGSASGNGRDHMNSLEQLVYEYSDAGMRVAEIARELGIGKGEVRLIQSLRKNKGQ